VAFSVPSLQEMLSLRDRIRGRGHLVLGPVDHGFCHSLYFSGPEGLSLEVCCNTDKEIDARAWIDPECVERHGISAEELARYIEPTGFKDQGGGVPQPQDIPQKYPPMFEGDLLKRVLAMNLDELSQMMGGNQPPVTVAEPA